VDLQITEIDVEQKTFVDLCHFRVVKVSFHTFLLFGNLVGDAVGCSGASEVTTWVRAFR